MDRFYGADSTEPLEERIRQITAMKIDAPPKICELTTPQG